MGWMSSAGSEGQKSWMVFYFVVNVKAVSGLTIKLVTYLSVLALIFGIFVLCCNVNFGRTMTIDSES